MSRRTKIVCTIGPASRKRETIRRLIDAGMDVARLNFSHGDHAEHEETFGHIRATSETLEAHVAVMMDLQGPKIRMGRMKDTEDVELEKGAPVTITTDDVLGDARRISTTYQHFPADVRPGDRVLIADGSVELRVCSVEPPDVHCEVVRGGLVGQYKGINLPGVRITEPSLTEKDREDLVFGLSLGVDYVALSFVRSPQDLRDIRAVIDAAGADVGVIAKIERPEAVQCFDEILPLCDGIMIARGDMGVEMSLEAVPVVQKRLIRACNEHGIPVITATQMLESMTRDSRPTRAEVGDVANAVFDGTDAVMLSAETASGRYPVEACATMAGIAREADEEMGRTMSEARWGWLRAASLRHRNKISPEDKQTPQELFAGSLGLAVAQMAGALRARCIVCYTSSGYTAAAIARYRPTAPIFAITDHPSACRRCALHWGVAACCAEEVDGIEAMFAQVDRLMIEKHLAEPGDTVIIAAGTPLPVAGRANLLKLHTVGESASGVEEPQTA